MNRQATGIITALAVTFGGSAANAFGLPDRYAPNECAYGQASYNETFRDTSELTTDIVVSLRREGSAKPDFHSNDYYTKRQAKNIVDAFCDSGKIPAVEWSLDVVGSRGPITYECESTVDPEFQAIARSRFTSSGYNIWLYQPNKDYPQQPAENKRRALQILEQHCTLR